MVVRAFGRIETVHANKQQLFRLFSSISEADRERRAEPLARTMDAFKLQLNGSIRVLSARINAQVNSCDEPPKEIVNCLYSVRLKRGKQLEYFLFLFFLFCFPFFPVHTVRGARSRSHFYFTAKSPESPPTCSQYRSNRVS